jgi:hypothetical protein
MSEIGIHFGAICFSIDKQLNDQGFCLSAEESKRFQKISDSITMLNLHGYLSDSLAHKARQRLLKAICNAESLVEADP